MSFAKKVFDREATANSVYQRSDLNYSDPTVSKINEFGKSLVSERKKVRNGQNHVSLFAQSSIQKMQASVMSDADIAILKAKGIAISDLPDKAVELKNKIASGKPLDETDRAIRHASLFHICRNFINEKIAPETRLSFGSKNDSLPPFRYLDGREAKINLNKWRALKPSEQKAAEDAKPFFDPNLAPEKRGALYSRLKTVTFGKKHIRPETEELDKKRVGKDQIVVAAEDIPANTVIAGYTGMIGQPTDNLLINTHKVAFAYVTNSKTLKREVYSCDGDGTATKLGTLVEIVNGRIFQKPAIDPGFNVKPIQIESSMEFGDGVLNALPTALQTTRAVKKNEELVWPYGLKGDVTEYFAHNTNAS